MFDPAGPSISLLNNVDNRASSPKAMVSHGSGLARGLLFSSKDPESSEQAFHIAFVKTMPIGAPAPPPSTNTDCTIVSLSPRGQRHTSYRKIPAYITNRKEKINEREEAQMRRCADAPAGLVLMEESD